MNLVSEFSRIEGGYRGKPNSWNIAGASFTDREDGLFVQLNNVTFDVVFVSEKCCLKDKKIKALKKSINNSDFGNYAVDCRDGSYVVLSRGQLRFAFIVLDYHPTQNRVKLRHNLDSE